MRDALDGRHVLISGGGSGIGAAIADAASAAGAQVTLLGRTAGKLEKKAAALPRAQIAVADVSDPAAVAAAFAAAAKTFGPVSILVNNAGQASAKAFMDTDISNWRQTLEVNMTGAFLCTQAVLPDMIAAKWGRIVNIASTAGLIPYKGAAAYVAAKHGLIGLTRALALEYAESGITVNAVCPGYTETEMAAQAISNIRARKNISEADARAILAARNPQKRLIAPAEVASVVLWLCRGENGSMTGQAIPVAGGEVMP